MSVIYDLAEINHSLVTSISSRPSLYEYESIEKLVDGLLTVVAAINASY